MSRRRRVRSDPFTGCITCFKTCVRGGYTPIFVGFKRVKIVDRGRIVHRLDYLVPIIEGLITVDRYNFVNPIQEILEIVYGSETPIGVILLVPNEIVGKVKTIDMSKWEDVRA